MKYLQDDSGNTLAIPVNVLLFKRTVSFITWSIRGDFSTDFSLPNDSEVRKIIGYTNINQLNSVTNKAFQMMSDGNQIATGKLFIKAVGTQIDLFFVSGNSNWINRITGSLRDVDMSDYDVTMSGPNINALRTATSGIIFPVVDWLYNFNKLTNTYVVTRSGSPAVPLFEVYELYPCFYEHTVFERLFDAYDLRLDGPLFDDPVYKGLIFTPEQIDSDNFVAPKYGGGAQLITTGPSSGYQSVSSGVTALITIASATIQSNAVFNSADNSVTFSMASQSLMTFLNVFVTGVSGPPKTVDLVIYKNGIAFITTSFSVPTSGAYSMASIFDAGAVAVNDKFQVYIKPTGTNIRIVSVSITYNLQNPSDFIRIQNVMPDIAQIDFVKHIAQRFNCMVDYDDLTQTVIFTPLDMIRLADAVDISDKVISYKQLPSSGYAARNYIRASEADELKIYASNDVNFGDQMIESDGEGPQDVYVTIFKPAHTSVSVKQNWLSTYVPLLQPEDADAGLSYTGVSNSGGVAKFTNGVLFADVDGKIVRVKSNGGLYTGYGYVSTADNTGMTIIGLPYGGNDSGRIFVQQITYPLCGSRELFVVPNLNVNAFNAGSPIYGDQNIKLYDGSTWPYTSAAWAFYAKPGINTVLDNINVGMNYGPILDSSTIDFGKLYNKTLKKIIRGRRAECQVLLTETEYDNLVLASYYFIRTEDFSGYFLITDMSGFQDSDTPVTFNLVLTD